MSLERKNYHQLETPVGPYVHAVKHAGFVFISGLTAFGTESQGLGVDRQAESIFQQLKVIAAAEGSSLESLVKVTIFVTSVESIMQLREVLFREYGKSLPASSLVQVAALFSPEVNVEIEAILAVPNA